MTINSKEKLWEQILKEADVETKREPTLASYLHDVILRHSNLGDALSYQLAGKLGNETIPSISLREIFDESYEADGCIIDSVCEDIICIFKRDPAVTFHFVPLLYLKGFHALESYRTANWLWKQERLGLAYYLQSRISEKFAVDIHPAAKIGRGIMIDHATSVVVGETAVVEDNVSILHEVTLGGTGKESGDRHPKVRRGVLIGAGAKLLGNIEIGEGAKIGAGSVVLEDVPPHVTAVGVPAEVIAETKYESPALEMDHQIPKKHCEQ